jgi:hypothetical protein
MINLAEATGRQQAHEIVYQAAQAAINDHATFRDQRLADPRVTSGLTAPQIDRFLDPAAYTGLSERIARDSAQRARQAAARCSANTTRRPNRHSHDTHASVTGIAVPRAIPETNVNFRFPACRRRRSSFRLAESSAACGAGHRHRWESRGRAGRPTRSARPTPCAITGAVMRYRLSPVQVAE